MPACAYVSRDRANLDCEAVPVLRNPACITIPENVLERSTLLSEQLKLCGSVWLPVTDDAAKEWIRLARRLGLKEPSASLLKLSLRKACSILEV
jgi:hypothetical protein